MQVMKEEVKLEAPGAGLPGFEAKVAKLVFPLLAKLRSPAVFRRLFEDEARTILQLVDRISDAQGGKRVLIDRVRGIEDSRRHWSVFMTLEHLAMVHLGIVGVIKSLGAGSKPGREVRIEDVKPDPKTGPEAVEHFQKSLELVRKVGEGMKSRSKTPGHEHPWFGVLSARQWYALVCVHMKIHRRQIEAILAGIN